MFETGMTRGLMLVAAIGAGTLSLGCGSSPSVSGYVYLVDDSREELQTFALDETTGELRLQGQIPVRAVRLVAADPAGRFLYLAGGSLKPTWDGQARVPGFVRTYGIQPENGGLELVSELSLEGDTLEGCGVCSVVPTCVVASDAYVHAELTARQGTSSRPDYWRSFRVDSQGALSPVGEPVSLQREPRSSYGGRLLFTTDLVTGWGILGSDGGGEFATLALGPDGRAYEVARSVHWKSPWSGISALGSVMAGDSLIVGYDLGTSRQFRTFTLNRTTGRLAAPVAADGCYPTGMLAGPDGLFAASCSGSYLKRPLLLYSVDAGGTLTLTDEQPDAGRALAFDPSGRTLLIGRTPLVPTEDPWGYRYGSPTLLRVYAIDADRRLRLLHETTGPETLPRGMLEDRDGDGAADGEPRAAIVVPPR